MKIGVILCDCGKSLAKVIDYERVIELAKGLEGVVQVKRTSLLCKNAKEVLKDFKGLDGIIFAACSEKYSLSFNEEKIANVLRSLDINTAKFEVANFREQCAWIHAYDEEAATRKALDLLLIAYEKLKTNQEALIFDQVVPRVLVIGSGVAGLSCALSLHKMGVEVDVVEKSPYIGGHAIQTFRVWQSQQYPSSCTTACSVLSLLKEASYAGFPILTNTEIQAARKEKGNFTVTLLKKPLFVDPAKCSSCGKCAEVCPQEVDNVFEYALKKRKAIDKDYKTAIPDSYYIIESACDKCGKCIEVCPNDGINLEDKPQTITKHYGAVVMATGFREDNPNGLSYNGRNIISPMQLERLMENRFLLKKPKQVAFVVAQRGTTDYCAHLSWAITLKLAHILQTKQKIQVKVFYNAPQITGKALLTFKEEAAQ